MLKPALGFSSFADIRSGSKNSLGGGLFGGASLGVVSKFQQREFIPEYGFAHHQVDAIEKGCILSSHAFKPTDDGI
jgi:hypothetical protein